MKLSDRGVSVSVRSLSDRIQTLGNALAESYKNPEIEPDLLVEILHGGGTEEDEEANP